MWRCPEAERGFRKLDGYRAIPTLVAALRANNTEPSGSKLGVDKTRDAAQLRKAG